MEVLKDRNIVSFSPPALANSVTQKWRTFANGKKLRGALVKTGVQQGEELTGRASLSQIVLGRWESKRWGEGGEGKVLLCGNRAEAISISSWQKMTNSLCFLRRTRLLQWSIYLLAALGFFQAVRFFQLTFRLLWEKKSLSNIPSCKKPYHKNVQ